MRIDDEPLSWAEHVAAAIEGAEWTVRRFQADRDRLTDWSTALRIYVADHPLDAIVEALPGVPAGPARAFMVAAIDRPPLDEILDDVVEAVDGTCWCGWDAPRAERVAMLARCWTEHELRAAAATAGPPAHDVLIDAADVRARR